MNKKLLTIILSLFFIIPLTVNANSFFVSTTETFMGNNEPSITLNGTNLRILNGAGLTMEIFNITGIKVATFKIDSNDKMFNLNLNRGCYIVKIGKISRKISIL
ncbi:T9SS type A sorting domain-containing protein [Alloprevotella rava]|uniref:T9SS C-terminal target domain-containing protein n=1 Tax=Alloprevotella rava TaxID=671218 RepID=A0A7W5XYJ8_9BACT|nr:T9SS type A sorting domain-containing protein [Alloprevotella rava]MBB3703688.1 hypothetical protein [Alloprevotella rava]